MLVFPRFGSPLIHSLICVALMLCNFDCYAQQADLKQSISIPSDIINKAQQQGLPISTLKLQGDTWVACILTEKQGEVCIVLGKNHKPNGLGPSFHPPASTRTLANLDFGAKLVVQQYAQLSYETTLRPEAFAAGQTVLPIGGVGQVTKAANGDLAFHLHPNCEARVYATFLGKQQVLDALPRYRREGTNIVRTKDITMVQQYIDAHPTEPFLVLVTVPSQCEPCRKMDHVLSHSIATSPTPINVKTFILEYFSFQDAQREVLGPNALFPTTLAFSPMQISKRQSPSISIGNASSYSLEEQSRTLREKFKRGAPSGIARGFISADSLKVLAQFGRPQS